MPHIDPVAAALLAAAFIFSQIRSVPLNVRYWGLCGVCVIIGVQRLRLGAVGFNLGFAVFALGLAIYYGVKAIKSSR